MPRLKLDAIDRRILVALQRDARLTNVELADEVGLSPSPCLRRVRMLEDAGVITGYHAELAREEVGLGLTVFVGIKVERHHDNEASAFREAVLQLPEVVSCHLVSGETDFLLQSSFPTSPPTSAWCSKRCSSCLTSRTSGATSSSRPSRTKHRSR